MILVKVLLQSLSRQLDRRLVVGVLEPDAEVARFALELCPVIQKMVDTTSDAPCTRVETDI